MWAEMPMFRTLRRFSMSGIVLFQRAVGGPLVPETAEDSQAGDGSTHQTSTGRKDCREHTGGGNVPIPVWGRGRGRAGRGWQGEGPGASDIAGPSMIAIGAHPSSARRSIIHDNYRRIGKVRRGFPPLVPPRRP